MGHELWDTSKAVATTEGAVRSAIGLSARLIGERLEAPPQKQSDIKRRSYWLEDFHGQSVDVAMNLGAIAMNINHNFYDYSFLPDIDTIVAIGDVCLDLATELKTKVSANSFNETMRARLRERQEEQMWASYDAEENQRLEQANEGAERWYDLIESSDDVSEEQFENELADWHRYKRQEEHKDELTAAGDIRYSDPEVVEIFLDNVGHYLSYEDLAGFFTRQESRKPTIKSQLSTLLSWPTGVKIALAEYGVTLHVSRCKPDKYTRARMFFVSLPDGEEPVWPGKEPIAVAMVTEPDTQEAREDGITETEVKPEPKKDADSPVLSAGELSETQTLERMQLIAEQNAEELEIRLRAGILVQDERLIFSPAQRKILEALAGGISVEQVVTVTNIPEDKITGLIDKGYQDMVDLAKANQPAKAAAGRASKL